MRSLAFAGVLLAGGLLRAAGPGADDRAFDSLVDEYYADDLKHHPTNATAYGFHDWDGELEDLSQASVDDAAARARRFSDRFAQVKSERLSPARATDLAFLRSSLAATLVEYERIHTFRREPDVYSGLASRAVYVIIKRDFAPAAERMKSVIARERKIPSLLAQGEKNLRDVPRVFVEIALEELPGIVGFFKSDVPRAFSTVKDPALVRELADSTGQATRAFEGYETFLRTKILPNAKSAFAIGEENFRAKLRTEEMIETPLDELLARGENELHRLQAEFKKVAARIDPGKPPLEVQRELAMDHGTPATLIADTQARLAGMRRFLVEHHIVSLPSEVMPRVEETPPFMRATTMASMETPGPFETHATEAYFNVTLPEKSWTAAQVEEFMRGAFNHALIDTTAIHEAFPGHYVQFLWMPHLSSKVRKLEAANTNVEGWAHYCEQMMLDEGWGNGSLPLRLAQLQDALLRAARYVAGIRMHTRGMTLEQAIDFFQKEGYQSAKVAQMEARRGTEDPTYLYYTLGKLEILKLRDDYQRKLGAAFTLQKFHDAFLAEGALPLPLLRATLLK